MGARRLGKAKGGRYPKHAACPCPPKCGLPAQQAALEGARAHAKNVLFCLPALCRMEKEGEGREAPGWVWEPEYRNKLCGWQACGVYNGCRCVGGGGRVV